MRPACCNEHGTQFFVPTSPLLATLIENKSSIDGERIRKINIRSLERDFEIQVDEEFFLIFSQCQIVGRFSWSTETRFKKN